MKVTVRSEYLDFRNEVGVAVRLEPENAQSIGNTVKFSVEKSTPREVVEQLRKLADWIEQKALK